MEGLPEFYKLDRTKPVRTEEHVGKVSAFFIVGIVFTVSMAAFTIYAFAGNNGNGIQSLPAVFFFICFSLAFLGFGIYQQKKYNKINRAERELLKNCLCTDGIITECESIRRTYSSGDSERYYYDVTVSYSFYNEENELQYRTFQKTYNCDPEFYVGQWLMIAFNETYSAVLNRYSFVKEDAEKFLQNQLRRSDDDFDGLDGEPIEYIENTKPLKSLENNKILLWLAICLSVVAVIYAVSVGFIAFKLFFDGGNLIEVIIGCLITCLAPAVLLTAIICLLCKYIKRQKRVSNILNNNPYFARGKIFFSEKTYGNKNRKQVLYCYIDKWAEKHTEVLKAALTTALIRPQDAIIAYTPDGKSVPVDVCSIPNDGQNTHLK